MLKDLILKTHSVHLVLEIRILMDFKIYRQFNIQNGGLHGLNRSQNFDFQIALTFLFYM